MKVENSATLPMHAQNPSHVRAGQGGQKICKLSSEDCLNLDSRPSPSSTRPHSLASLFDLARDRPCGGGNSGEVRKLNNLVDSVNKQLKDERSAKKDLEDAAKLVAARVSTKADELRQRGLSWEEACTTAADAAKDTLEWLDAAHEGNKDAENARASLFEACAPLVAWASDQGARDTSENAVSRWLELAANKPESGPEETVAAWVQGEIELAAKSGQQEPWVPEQDQLPAQESFSKAVKAFALWKQRKSWYDKTHNRTELSSKKTKELYNDASAVIDHALGALEEAELWVQREAAPYEDSATARGARSTAVAEIARKRSKFCDMRLKLDGLSKDILIIRANHDSEMQSIRSGHQTTEYTRRRDQESTILQAQLQQAYEIAEKHEAARKQEADEARARSKDLEGKLVTVQKQHEQVLVAEQLRLNQSMPSATSRQATISRNSRPAPTRRDNSAACPQAHNFATSFREKIVVCVDKLAAPDANIEAWNIDVADALDAWEPLVAIRKMITSSGTDAQNFELFQKDIKGFFSTFADQYLRCAKQLRVINKNKPEAAENQVRAALNSRWSSLHLSFACLFQEWMESLRLVD